MHEFTYCCVAPFFLFLSPVIGMIADLAESIFWCVSFGYCRRVASALSSSYKCQPLLFFYTHTHVNGIHRNCFWMGGHFVASRLEKERERREKRRIFACINFSFFHSQKMQTVLSQRSPISKSDFFPSTFENRLWGFSPLFFSHKHSLWSSN